MTVSRGAVLAAGVMLAAFSVEAHVPAVTVTGTAPQCQSGLSIKWTRQINGQVFTNPVAMCQAVTQFGADGNGGHAVGNLTYGPIGPSTVCSFNYGSTDGLGSNYSEGFTSACIAPTFNPTCSNGQAFTQTVTVVQGTAVPTSACVAGCFGTLTKALALFTFWRANGPDEEVRNVTYTQTGATCGTVDNVGSLAPDGCAISASGRKVCTSKNNCGTVNGNEVCADPASSCGSVNGQQFCLDASGADKCWRGVNGGDSYCAGHPSSATSIVVTPPAPNSGTPGDAAQPDFSVSGQSAGLTGDQTGNAPSFRVDVFTPTQVGSSTVAPGGEGGTTISGEGGGAVCGAPPLPACSVDIDETGTPTGTAPAEWDGDAAQEAVADAADAAPSSGWNLRGLLPDVDSNTCQSITLTYFGRSLEFPGTKGCDWIEDLKSILAFCLFFGTAAAIARLVIGSV